MLSLGSSRRTVFQVLIPGALEALHQSGFSMREAGVPERWEWVRGSGQERREVVGPGCLEQGFMRWDKNDR